MLTAADLDIRPDPGPAYPHHLRVAWRLVPGLSDDDLAAMAAAAPQEDPDVAARCAGE